MDAPQPGDFTQKDIDESLTINLFEVIDLPGVPKSWEKKLDRFLVGRLMGKAAYRTLFSFVERGGLYAGNAFLGWLRGKLTEKDSRFADMTLEQFHAATGRDLTLATTDTTKQRMRVLNHRTAPNCPVAGAVRMSMSIPFAWHEVRWRPEWSPYRRFDSTGKTVESETPLDGNVIVDGGALSNFPIDLLTSDEPSVRAFMGDADPNAHETLGLLIDEKLEVPNAPPAPDLGDEDEGDGSDLKKLRTVKRVSRLMHTMMNAHDQKLIAANEHLICRLPAEGYGTMEFDMTPARREALVAAGQAAMRAHLDRRGEGF